ncbi:MAG: sialate O-acetylesterase [Pirellulales bacterium]|nr:sialate O-acetylesterase [Pirellulales bacterium]
MSIARALVVCANFLLYTPLLAEVELPNVFSSHMVLQRDLSVPVWGWAVAGEKVTVRFAGQVVRTTANDLGTWSVKLNPLDARDVGINLEVEGENKIVLEDVLVGDVWICSGQSNMEWQVLQSLNGKQEIESADHPGIRLFDVPGHTTAALPQSRGAGAWQVCAPETVGTFSAVGYYFGRQLLSETSVPVGLIGTNWGGTRIEPWTPPIGFRTVAELKELANKVDQFDPTVPVGRAVWETYLTNVEAWTTAARKAVRASRVPPKPVPVPGFTSGGDPTAIYNSMVQPLIPYGIRGAIWYQGESNGGEGVEYFHKMQALIGGWRQVWKQGDFPLYFYFVQLADYLQPTNDPAGGDGWSPTRQAQFKALEIPHTGMAVITDIGTAGDVHPRNKQDVGARLARWALRDVHGQAIVPSGPLYRAFEVEGDKIRLRFDHVGSGLMVGQKAGLAPTQEDSEGELARFAIAGSDKKWSWAIAVIDGGTVVVSSPDVKAPVAVRYAYSMNPAGANLYNKEGLPASPFRTDQWK